MSHVVCPYCSPYTNDASFLLAAYILTESVALVCLDIIGYVDNSYLREIAASIQFIEVSCACLSSTSLMPFRVRSLRSYRVFHLHIWSYVHLMSHIWDLCDVHCRPSMQASCVLSWTSRL